MTARHSTKTSEAKRKQQQTGGGWNGVERRRGVPSAPVFAALLVESQWTPPVELLDDGQDGWFRAHGHAEDRRRAARERSAVNR